MPSSSASSPLSLFPILVLALLSAVAPLATDMYLPGFPLLGRELGASATQVQMTLTGFLFGLALGQLIIGPLSDRYGRRRPLLIGTAINILSSLLCIVAPSIETLILLRVMQGIGGAAGVVLARAVISDRTTDTNSAAKLFQVMMMIGGLAPVLAPIAGTGIVSVAGWRAVFVVIALLSTLSFIGVVRLIPESLPEARRNTGGLGAFAGSVRGLLGNRCYIGYTLTTAFTFMVLFGYISASPFVFQTVLGLSPTGYSLAFGTNAIGIALVSAVSAKLVDRVTPRRLAAAGLVLILAAAVAVMAAVLAEAGAWVMLPCLFVAIASLGLVLGNASALAIGQAPHVAGTASAVLGATQFCLGAVASPLTGLGGEDNALPMALVMIAAGVLSLACFLLLTREREPEMMQHQPG